MTAFRIPSKSIVGFIGGDAQRHCHTVNVFTKRRRGAVDLMKIKLKLDNWQLSDGRVGSFISGC